MMPALNPALDAAGLAQTYARDGRIHIPGILTDDSARRVHQCLVEETDYSLLWQTGVDKAMAFRVAGLHPQAENQLVSDVYGRARDKFEYLYDAHSLSKEGEPYADPAHYLAAVNLFLNGPAMLDFVRKLTGRPEIRATSIQATRYRPGHFLNQHDDHNDPRRIAAYVLNMTPHWRGDWGGALLFPDRPGHIAEGFLPAFNALNMFSVPQEHQVAFVAPFAGAHRFSVTGWFLA
jgi:SM-20-related protein